jgi:hypothetical protein
LDPVAEEIGGSGHDEITDCTVLIPDGNPNAFEGELADSTRDVSHFGLGEDDTLGIKVVEITELSRVHLFVYLLRGFLFLFIFVTSDNLKSFF